MVPDSFVAPNSWCLFWHLLKRPSFIVQDGLDRPLHWKRPFSLAQDRPVLDEPTTFTRPSTSRAAHFHPLWTRLLKFLRREYKQSQTWWTLWSIFEGEMLHNEQTRYDMSRSCYWKNDTGNIPITAHKACVSSKLSVYRLLWCNQYPSRHAWILWNRKKCWFSRNIFLIIWSSSTSWIYTILIVHYK